MEVLKESTPLWEARGTNVVRELVAGKPFLFSEREPAALKGVEEPLRLFTLGEASR